MFILWCLFTSCGGRIRDAATGKIRQNIKILFLAPQKSHVANVFDRVRAFLAMSPGLAACIDRNVRGSPQIISVKSSAGIGAGNMISGYPSGDASGSKGLAARGNDADVVILDEGAFISPDTITNVINPILYTRNETRFFVSSTPSGIPNDYFETICTRRPDFAEFYVPATKRPDWDKVEDQVRRDFGANQEEWDKEVMALFAPAGIGVYRGDLVKLSQSDFEYGSLGPNRSMIYTFGVDWNKEHGTEIAIVGTAKGGHHVSYLVQAITIPKKEFTTPSGIGRIIELFRIWKPLWIYVDAGGGDGGPMLIHHGRMAAGKDPEEAQLMYRVKTYDFGSKVQIQNVDGSTQDVPAKQFMVENSVRKFELGEIKYPRSDLLLSRQLDNYIVSRRTPAGVPIYKPKEPRWADHRLDAFNLALVAVRLEFPSFHDGGLSAADMGVGLVPDRGMPVPTRTGVLPQWAGVSGKVTSRTMGQSRPVSTGGKCWGFPPDDDKERQARRSMIGRSRQHSRSRIGR